MKRLGSRAHLVGSAAHLDEAAVSMGEARGDATTPRTSQRVVNASEDCEHATGVLTGVGCRSTYGGSSGQTRQKERRRVHPIKWPPRLDAHGRLGLSPYKRLCVVPHCSDAVSQSRASTALMRSALVRSTAPSSAPTCDSVHCCSGANSMPIGRPACVPATAATVRRVSHRATNSGTTLADAPSLEMGLSGCVRRAGRRAR